MIVDNRTNTWNSQSGIPVAESSDWNSDTEIPVSGHSDWNSHSGIPVAPRKPVTAAEVIDVGNALMDAREYLKGNFTKWVKDCCPFSHTTALVYIAKAKADIEKRVASGSAELDAYGAELFASLQPTELRTGEALSFDDRLEMLSVVLRGGSILDNDHSRPLTSLIGLALVSLPRATVGDALDVIARARLALQATDIELQMLDRIWRDAGDNMLLASTPMARKAEACAADQRGVAQASASDFPTEGNEPDDF